MSDATLRAARRALDANPEDLECRLAVLREESRVRDIDYLLRVAAYAGDEACRAFLGDSFKAGDADHVPPWVWAREIPLDPRCHPWSPPSPALSGRWLAFYQAAAFGPAYLVTKTSCYEIKLGHLDMGDDQKCERTLCAPRLRVLRWCREWIEARLAPRVDPRVEATAMVEWIAAHDALGFVAGGRNADDGFEAYAFLPCPESGDPSVEAKHAQAAERVRICVNLLSNMLPLVGSGSGYDQALRRERARVAVSHACRGWVRRFALKGILPA